MSDTPYFSLEHLTSLDKVPKRGRVHVIGVAGVAMAQISILLSKMGYEVSGSDKDFYEPMGSQLKASSIALKHGYSAENISAGLSLVLIGNVASATHPEALAVAQKKIPYTIFPQLLYETIIKGKHSMVVSGTHGKSTSSAMLACALIDLKAKPSYFFGAASRTLASGLHSGEGKFSVVEGDEYDSAFFAKVPKFSFYKPDTLIVTSVEFDHADIYASLEQINQEFTKLAVTMPSSTRVLACVDSENVRQLVKHWRAKSKASVITYGKSNEAEYRLLHATQNGLRQKASCQLPSGEKVTLELAIPGEYNALNGLAVFAALREAGFDSSPIVKALANFKGIKRRQELRFDQGNVTLIEDFAHHPTAVHETLTGLRAAFPSRRLWAVFEPRSNTSRRKIFQQEYIRAFSAADRVLLCEVQSREVDQGLELIDVKELAQMISASGRAAQCLANADAILKVLEAQVVEGDLIVLMSNGAFGGLPDLLTAALSKKFGATES